MVQPFVGESHAQALGTPQDGARQQRLLQLRAVGHHPYLVVAVGTQVQGILLEFHSQHSLVVHHCRSESYWCHGAAAHGKIHVVNALRGEETLVLLHEEVALGHALLQRCLAQAEAQRRRQARRHLHHVAEEHAVLLLGFRPRVAHASRPCPQAPPSAPLVADDRPYRPMVTV